MPGDPPSSPGGSSGPPTVGPFPSAADDRRAFRRAPLDRQVLIDDDRVSQPVRAKNVSGGGIAIDGNVPLEIGSIVDLYFELPIGVAIEARAEVVRVEDGSMAFRFIELDRDKIVALRSFCRLSGLHRLEFPIQREE
jgi:hypothetical protein